METEAISIFNEPEEGEILNEDPEELYVPLERPQLSSANSNNRSSLPASDSDDDENVSKESSSDSDASSKNINPAKMRRKAISTRNVGPNKKKYNIWSAELQTEVLTSSLVDCNVNQENDRWRDVETYNYKLGRPNCDNDIKKNYIINENKNKKQFSAKRRRDGAQVNKKDNIRNSDKQKKIIQSNARNILALSTTLENSEEELARDIANKLCETKEDLILRAISILGKEFIISLFEETKKIEASGGMMVVNGTRRRTPGGVFFYLLKTSDCVPREQINLVLSEDKKASTVEKRLRLRKNRQLQTEKFKKSLKEDDFPTLLSRTELAIKEFKARKLAEDSAEVKNPPPSPATDGKECSSDGEDPKERNDRKYEEDQRLTVYDCSLFGTDECEMDVF